jgi:hypothetical protein
MSAGGQGIVPGENLDASSRFTRPALFFIGHGQRGAYILMALNWKKDQTKDNRGRKR